MPALASPERDLRPGTLDRRQFSGAQVDDDLARIMHRQVRSVILVSEAALA
jgi:hypothetical protein